MKAIIIDDEQLSRQIVKENLVAFPDIQVVAECQDGFEAFKAITELKPDLIFLDIQMPKINGFELLELLEEPPQVIFITAYDEYALKAFEANAIDYLLKPFSQLRFNQSMQKISRQISPAPIQNLLQTQGKNDMESHRIVLKHLGNILILGIAEVQCIEAYDDYVKIHARNQVYVKKQTLHHFETVLPATDFVRIHRSFLVNLSHITAIGAGQGDTKEIRLKSGFVVNASRNGYQRLKEKMGL
jgi:two-component system LytT family response regulator